MISFRPHKLNLIKYGNGSYDSTGKFIPGGESVITDIECRFEPNGRANTIALEDGQVYVYSYMVYLNVDCPEISYGDEVELINAYGGFVGKFPVKGFHRGQLNAKIWL